ncbi:MAG: hypothetical protein K9J81_05560 [Desulfohalobiaceae bacterium]|nr:hypothetical protein [Desulfohalobiaceae bacterium]
MDKHTNISNCNRRQLYRYLRFYRLYPQKVGTPTTQLQIPPEKLAELVQSGTEKSESKKMPHKWEFPGGKIRSGEKLEACDSRRT